MTPNDFIRQPMCKVFTDGASLVAHDIAAQLHVIGFCLDELEKNLNPESERYFLQVKEAIGLINLEVSDFRSYLKDLVPSESDLEIKIMIDRVIRILNLFQGKLVRKINISWGAIPEGFVPANKVVQLTYALYSFILDGIQEIKNQTLKIDIKRSENQLVFEINEQWKSRWWEAKPQSQGTILKGMQSKIFGDEMIRVSESVIKAGEAGIMGRIPVSIRFNF